MTQALFTFADAKAVFAEAGALIWHSMQKYDGNPTHENMHPLTCGCVYCN